ncbi:MAG: hypothetical protein ACJA0K_000669 [Maricaulis maris]|jgi:hypothetical protein
MTANIDPTGAEISPNNDVGAQAADAPASNLTFKQKLSRTISQFVAMVANGLDIGEGASLVRDQAGSLYDAEHGEALETQAREIDQQQTRVDDQSREYNSVRSERQNTPEWERASNKRGKRNENGDAEVAFSEWALIHQATVVAAAILCLVMLGAGAANIQGNLVASGLPLFTLNPVFAWLFAMLAPAAALAIHSFGDVFRTWRGRNLYRAAIFILTGITVIAWSWLFADLFHGTGSGFDISFEEDGLADTLFVWLQVVAEILVGASLFLIIEHIAGQYSPNFWVRNLAYAELLERETGLEIALRDEQRRLNTLRGQHTERMAARASVINHAHAEYLQRVSRFSKA